jgi:hypothetical protein
MPSPLFTIVADWREAKPCIQTIIDNGQERHLVMTIIICETARQVGRATFFAESLPPEMGPVRVMLNSETEPGKIADYIAQSIDEIRDELAVKVGFDAWGKVKGQEVPGSQFNTTLPVWVVQSLPAAAGVIHLEQNELSV